jgi:signal transduction histidine kinase
MDRKEKITKLPLQRSNMKSNPTSEKQLAKIRNELKERHKELDCIYNISKIVDRHNESGKIIQEIVDIIPGSWQFPDKTCCRVLIDDECFISCNFIETPFSLKKDIKISKEKIGRIEVFYINDSGALKKSPFLKAERNLLNVVAERLGKIVERKRAEHALENSYKHLQELYEHLQTVREDERKKIAIEIHDELGQALTSLKIDLRWLGGKMEENPERRNKIELMEQLVDGTIKRIQKIATDLRPPLLDDFGLKEAVLWYIEDITKRAGLSMNFKHDNSLEQLTRDSSMFIFQIIRELTTNVIRHANAVKMEISIGHIPGYLEIVFKDDGKGITIEQAESLKSFGLYNLKERVSYWGGTTDIAGITGRGTRIRISIPEGRVF